MFTDYLKTMKNKFSAMSFLIQKYKTRIDALEDELDEKYKENQNLRRNYGLVQRSMTAELERERNETRRAQSLGK